MKLAQILLVNYLRARLNLLAVISKKAAAKKAFIIFCTPHYRSKTPAPSIFEQGTAVSIRVKGNVVRGFVWNKGGIKRVLILHGFESSCRNFGAYITGLLQKNYEVLAFDAPGHGSSGGRYIDLPLYVEMIAAIHFQFGIIQSFMAHSFGGLALAHFIEKIPHTAATKLALLAPATETSSAIDSFFRFLQLGEGVRTEFERIIREKSDLPSTWFSIPRALQHIQASVLWVHDKGDDITPFRDVEPVMEKKYPLVSFYITEGLGHKKIYRNGKVIEAVLNFL